MHAQYHRPGNEYIFEWAPGWVTLGTLGFYVRPWALIDYPKVPPSVGRFEGKAFDPEEWKPEYPNPAFHNMRPDDAFWAARIVVEVRRWDGARDRGEGEIQRSEGDRLHHADADRAPRQGAEDVSESR